MSTPSLPLPKPLRGTEIPSFTNYSITVRLPDIARRVIADNELLPEHLSRVQQLIDEIPGGKIRFLVLPLAPDASEWRRYVEPYLGWDWLHIPWFFAEAYFYARIIEATGYFHPGPGQEVDPFIRQKRLGLDTSRAAIRTLAGRAAQIEDAASWQPADFLNLLSVDLWGNEVDLSLWPVSHGSETGAGVFHSREDHVLVDDSPALVSYLSGLPSGSARADFLLDNAGFELVCDLVLAGYLLQAGLFREVHLHAKAQPMFVSDALLRDIRHTLDFLRDEPDPAVREIAARLERAISAGRLVLHDHFFWTSPLPAWEMPAELYAELSGSHLLISKGDANYRRLLGDRHWDFTAPLDRIVNYLPAPVLLLRSMKSEIVAGLRAEQPEAAARVDPRWLIDGQWALIQFSARQEKI